MKIFVFKPSDYWSYCGGGIVVIADSIDDIRKIPELNEEEFLEKELDEASGCDYNKWILVETLPADESEQRVVLNDYNWG